MIAGSVGIACAFISVLLRQPKLPQHTQAPTEPTPVDAKVLVVD
jgi:hypothetical protein